MKKILFLATALAGLFLAASCQQENLEPVVAGTTLTYTVQVPGALSTKAIGDEITGDYTLYYEVYRATEVSNPEKGPVYEGSKAVGSNGAVTVELEFVKDQSFVVLFWAQNPDLHMFNKDDLRKVQLVSPGLSNNEYAAVFAGSDTVNNCVSTANNNVTLVRPISQLNIATNDESLEYGSVGITLSTSTVTVSGLSKVYNVATQEVDTVSEFIYEEHEVPSGQTLTVAGVEYTYAAMNYIGFAPQTGATVDVTFTVTTSEGDVCHSVPNVPVKPNYRTNIIGNLLTETSDFNVTLDKDWEDVAGGNIEFINDGLVKNLDGAYEVSNAKGLAYAINNLFVEGGDFYLTEPTYDLSAYNVVAPSIPAGVTLNLYGETPVVTRATVTVAGVTITGLPSALLDKVEGQVTISGINLPDTGSAFVNDNQGTVVVSESTATEVVKTGNAPFEADNIKDLATLKAALASDLKVIELAADIEATEVVQVGRSVVINGNGFTLTTSANRAIRLTASEIKVVINDFDIVSTAVMIYPSDVRGVSIDASLSNVSLTLNECSVDFTDVTTNDWTYAVNVSGSGTGHNVTVLGGYYEGANVINVHGEKNTVTVKNATLNSLYPEIEAYYGACFWVLQEKGSSVYAEGNTFEGYNAMVFNIGTGTTLVEMNNTDNTMFYYDGGQCYYVSSVEKLQYVVNKVNKNTVIKFAADLAGNVTILQKVGVNLVLDGDNHNFDGTFYLEGGQQGGQSPETLTFKNINFLRESGTVDFISADDAKTIGKRYAHNVTVEDCTFTGTVESVGMRYRQTFNMTVKNVTASGLHSLIQVNGGDGVTIDGATVEAKSGASFGTATNVLVKNSNFKAQAYGVRANGTDGNPSLKIENTTINAAQPVIVRKMTGAKLYAVELSNVDLQASAGYQVIFTSGDDGVACVEPTGNWSITGADDMVLYPRDFAVSTVEDLKAASKKTGNIYIVNDITVTSDWSYRTDAEFRNPVVIDGMGHTIKFVGKVANPNNNNAFRFENEAVVKNLTIDLSETPTASLRAISTKSAITVDNCEFIGNASTRSRAIIFGEGATAFDFAVSVANSSFENWVRGLTDNENGKDVKSVVVENNTFDNASVYVSAYESIAITGNVMNNSLVNITSYTAAPNVTVTATGNTLDTSLYNNIGSSSRVFSAANVEAQEGFTVFAE